MKNNSFGTGLGLSICKALSEKMNMKINYKSEKSKGTSFWILIHSGSKVSNNNLIFKMENVLNFSKTEDLKNKKNILSSLNHNVIENKEYLSSKSLIKVKYFLKK